MEQAPFKKVLDPGRGKATQFLKGPEMVQWNAIMSMKNVLGKLPVNLIFIAEGDEERMDIGLRKFVKDHPDLVKADAMLMFGTQAPSGGGGMMGGSEGCVYIELTTSGKSWGRGPTDSDIHGSHKREADSPAWRHIKMLASLVSDDGNTPKIQGFFDNIEPLQAAETERLKTAAAKVDQKVAAEIIGVARYISDDPFQMLKMSRYGTSFNLDGIWGGNMFAGGAGAILPNKVTSKHNIRYVPNMNGMDLVKKIRAQLDRNGYKDVELKLIGDVPWAKMSYDTDIARSITQDVRFVRDPPRPAIDDRDYRGRRLLARIPFWKRKGGREGRAGSDADRRGRGRTRRHGSRGQRIFRDRRRGKGLRHGGSAVRKSVANHSVQFRPPRAGAAGDRLSGGQSLQ